MIDNHKVLVVIPARLGGYRFPDKPLRKVHHKALIEWVYNHASRSQYADYVVIATPDQPIVEFCKEKSFNYVLTSPSHLRGTERVSEACHLLGDNWDIVVNFQGDEPLVTPELLDTAISSLVSDKDADCVNLFKWMTYEQAEKDQNEVKVVTNTQDYALYFSRNPIPALWLGDKDVKCKAEICVMPMWNQALKKFVELGNGPLEHIESVDMMRFVENGLRVKMVEAHGDIQSVDCQDDLVVAEKLLSVLYP